MIRQQVSVIRYFVLIVTVVTFAACTPTKEKQEESKSQTIRPVKTFVVERTVTKLERSYSAVVLAAQEVELSFRVSGRIMALPVRGGQNIKKGDVVAELDKRDFKAEITRLKSQLEQAEAQLAALKSGARAEDVAALEAAVSAVEAQVDAARDQLDRSQQLFKRKVVSKAKVDNDRTALRVAQAELEAKKQELAKGTAGARAEDVAAQEAAIRGLRSNLKSLEDNLADATLRAPFDGIVAIRRVDNFANIQAKEAIVTLQALSSPNLNFDIPATDVPPFAKAKSLELSVVLDSIPGRIFKAERSEFSTQADASTQTYRGRVSIENPDAEPILPGMTGVLTVSAGNQGLGTLQVPLVAIASQSNGEAFVWVVSPGENKVSKRSVVTGQVVSDSIAVTEGLSEGDIVISAGLSVLQENMVVKPITKTAE